MYVHASGFNANASGVSGSFSGPCIIHLNHQAITIINEKDEFEIAKWPYTCIRGFNFNEPGKFSFTSGSLAPFGVGQYTFEVQDVKTLKFTLKQIIQQQMRSRLKPQPYYYPQYQCPQVKNNDSLCLTGGSFPLRHSFSTGDLLDHESSSSNPQRCQVSHRTHDHVPLIVSRSDEGPRIIENEQHRYQSNSAQCTSGDVSALPLREWVTVVSYM